MDLPEVPLARPERWYADVLRNQGLAVPPPPTGYPGSESAFWGEFSTHYEPRSIAVSPSGERIIVGTKAGAIHQYELDRKRWEWIDRGSAIDTARVEKLWEQPRPRFRRAIRTLAFLDEDSFVGGGGSGLWSFQFADRPLERRELEVFDLDANGMLTKAAPFDYRAHLTEALATECPWRALVPRRRFTRLLRRVALKRPERALVLDPDGRWTALHLLLTPGTAVRAVVGRMHGGTSELRLVRAEQAVDLLNGLKPDEQIVQGFLLGARGAEVPHLVTASGVVLRVDDRRIGDDRAELQKIRLVRVGRLPLPHENSEITTVSVRDPWIGVQCGSEHTVVHVADLRPDPPTVDRSRWVHIARAREITLLRTSWADGPEKRGPHGPDPDNPLWMLVSSSRRGLAWIPWRPKSAHDLPEFEWESRVLYPGRKNPKWSLAGVGNADALLVSTRQVDLIPDRPETAVPYLLTATRNQRLRITSFIDTDKAHRLLLGSKAWLDAKDGLGERIKSGEAAWRAAQTICAEFGFTSTALISDRASKAPETAEQVADVAVYARPPIHRIAPFLRQLDEPDLHRLVKILGELVRRVDRLLASPEPTATVLRHRLADPLEYWLKEPNQYRWLEDVHEPGGDRAAVGAILAFQQWSLRILRRATELPVRSQEALIELATSLISVARSMRRKGPLDQLHLMADVWQKWIVEGHTYREKEGSLVDLARSNWECGRNLDGVAYAARLLRSRLDVVSESAIEMRHPNTIIKALAEAPGGRFVISSHHDGRIVATNAHGTLVRWKWAGAAGLEPLDEGVALRREGGREFLGLHWHGPFARCLAVVKRGNTFIILLPTKGDSPSLTHKPRDGAAAAGNTDREEPAWIPARLHVLHVRTLPASGEPGSETPSDPPQPVTSLEVLSARMIETPAEVYAIHVLEDSGPDELLALIGLQRPDRKEGTPHGLWLIGQHAGDELKPIKLAEGVTGVAGKDAAPVEDKSPGRGAELRYNPTWSLGVGRRPTVAPEELEQGTSAARTWHIFAGRQDGTLRRYEILRGESDGWTIRPVHWVVPGSESAAYATIGQPVTALAAALHADDTLAWLAYGTAEGIIGAYTSTDATSSSNPVAVQLFHSHESGWVKSVLAYQDFGPTDEAESVKTADSPVGDRGLTVVDPPRSSARTHLLAATDAGVLAVYDLSFGVDHTLRNRRFTPSGMRLDHFRTTGIGAIGLSAVACPTHTAMLGAEKLPTLVVGHADGQVRHYVLALPRRSARRREWFELAKRCFDPQIVPEYGVTTFDDRAPKSECLSNVFGFAGAMGREWTWRWLRVIDPGRLELVRFSLWMEQEWQAKELSNVDADAADADSIFHIYRKKLEYQLDEVQHRRPYARDGAKVLWEGAANVANNLASKALSLPRERRSAVRKGLEWYLVLNQDIDAVCNRWLGNENEAATLMHSGAALFDWPDVVILAASEPIADHAITVRLSRHLLDHVLRPRLTHSNPDVLVETLRVVNLAIMRTIHNQKNGSASVPRLTGSRRGGALWAEEDVDFMGVMTAVGSSVEVQRARLTRGDPLFTEVARFFAACLLLLPENAYAIGLVVSESRLLAGGRVTEAADIKIGVTDQFHLLREQLMHEGGVAPDPGWDRARDRFQSYLEDISVAQDREDGVRGAWYVDGDVSYERALVARVVRTLGTLSRKDEAGERDLRMFLELPVEDGTAPIEGGKLRYFRHSKAVFARLNDIREGFLADRRASRKTVDEICTAAEEVLDAPDGLFEPQRTLYRKEIVDRWRIEDRAGVAKMRGAFRAIYTYFRHRNAEVAESIVHSTRALILQQNPEFARQRRWISAEKTLRRSFREAIEARVNHSSSVGEDSLHAYRDAYAARDTLLLLDDLVAALDNVDFIASKQTTSIQEIGELLGHACVHERLKPKGPKHCEGAMPGPCQVWRALLELLVQNISEHGSSDHCNTVTWTYGEGHVTLRGDVSFYDALIRQKKFSRADPRKNLLHRLKEEAAKLGDMNVDMDYRDRSGRSRGRGLRLVQGALCTPANLIIQARLHHSGKGPADYPLEYVVSARPR